MGMYLDVVVVYGVAWGDAPAECYPEYPEGHEYEGNQIDTGEAVYGGRLVWATHGNHYDGRHLEVCEAPSGEFQGSFAARVLWEEIDVDDMVKWDGWIIGYLTSLGLAPERIPTPGWLAVASFG
jgi:hypothetical protein